MIDLWITYFCDAWFYVGMALSGLLLFPLWIAIEGAHKKRKGKFMAHIVAMIYIFLFTLTVASVSVADEVSTRGYDYYVR